MPARARRLAAFASLLGAPVLLAQDTRSPTTSQRDSVRWSLVLDSAAFHDFPITDPRQVIVLQPGVIETGHVRGVSIRGSAPGGAATFIDGALIRNGQRGEADLLLGLT